MRKAGANAVSGYVAGILGDLVQQIGDVALAHCADRHVVQRFGVLGQVPCNLGFTARTPLRFPRLQILVDQAPKRVLCVTPGGFLVHCWIATERNLGLKFAGIFASKTEWH